jgi:nucleolar pre-ribosomal-associated protein 1
MTLLVPREDEGLLWMRVLENILDVVDPVKLESATGGEWRAAIGRCMTLLQGDAGAYFVSLAVTQTNRLAVSTSLIVTLRLKSRLIMKLGLLPGPTVPTFEVLLSNCLIVLRNMEKDLVIPAIPVALRSSSLSRHTSHSLREREADTTDSRKVWGDVVISLWRASMASGNTDKAWDELTPRVLVWNLLIDGEDHTAEWARREVVWNMTQTM